MCMLEDCSTLKLRDAFRVLVMNVALSSFRLLIPLIPLMLASACLHVYPSLGLCLKGCRTGRPHCETCRHTSQCVGAAGTAKSLALLAHSAKGRRCGVSWCSTRMVVDCLRDFVLHGTRHFFVSLWEVDAARCVILSPTWARDFGLSPATGKAILDSSTWLYQSFTASSVIPRKYLMMSLHFSWAMSRRWRRCSSCSPVERFCAVDVHPTQPAPSDLARWVSDLTVLASPIVRLGPTLKLLPRTSSATFWLERHLRPVAAATTCSEFNSRGLRLGDRASRPPVSRLHEPEPHAAILLSAGFGYEGLSTARFMSSQSVGIYQLSVVRNP